jgi:uncharacterized protein YceK
MKKKQNLFHGFAILVIMAIMVVFSMSGCATMASSAEFPSQLRGTWIREEPAAQNTLTITQNTYRLSNQASFWILDGITDDGAYILSWGEDRNHRATVPLKLVDGNIEVGALVRAAAPANPNQTVGTWKKQ